MGLSAVTKLDSGTNAAPIAATQATASKSPTAYRTQCIGVLSNKIGGALAAPTLSGNGLTWTQVDTVTYNSVAVPLSRLSVFKSSGAAPTTGAVTITHASTPTTISWYWIESDKDIFPASNGVDNHAHNSADAATALTATLATFKDASNGALAFLGLVTGITPTAGTGWTSLGVESTILDAQWRADPDTTADETFASSNAAIIALELDTGNRATPEHQSYDPALASPSGGNGATPDVSKAYDAGANQGLDGQYAIHVKYVASFAATSFPSTRLVSTLASASFAATTLHAVSIGATRSVTAFSAVSFNSAKLTTIATLSAFSSVSFPQTRLNSKHAVSSLSATSFSAAGLISTAHLSSFAAAAFAASHLEAIRHLAAFSSVAFPAVSIGALRILDTFPAVAFPAATLTSTATVPSLVCVTFGIIGLTGERALATFPSIAFHTAIISEDEFSGLSVVPFSAVNFSTVGLTHGRVYSRGLDRIVNVRVAVL